MMLLSERNVSLLASCPASVGIIAVGNVFIKRAQRKLACMLPGER